MTTYDKPPVDSEHRCPNCNYCPHCGRSDQPVRRRVPFFDPFPVYPGAPTTWTYDGTRCEVDQFGTVFIPGGKK